MKSIIQAYLNNANTASSIAEVRGQEEHRELKNNLVWQSLIILIMTDKNILWLIMTDKNNLETTVHFVSQK